MNNKIGVACLISRTAEAGETNNSQLALISSIQIYNNEKSTEHLIRHPYPRFGDGM